MDCMPPLHGELTSYTLSDLQSTLFYDSGQRWPRIDYLSPSGGCNVPHLYLTTYLKHGRLFPGGVAREAPMETKALLCCIMCF